MNQLTKLVPELRFPEFDGKWKQDPLNKLAKVNPRNKELPDKFIYIDLESVTKGILVKEETISAQEAPSRAQRVLEKGDILYQTVRPYQKNNYFFDKDGDYVASTGYAQIKAKYDSEYLFQFLHNQNFVNIVNRRSTGTSYPAISPSELVKIKVNYPTVLEQQKIASFLSQVDKKIDLLTQKVEQLELYKKGVMQKLFSQEIRFKPDLSGDEGEDNGEAFPEWEEKRLGLIGETYSGLSGKTKDDFGDGDNYIQYKQIFDNSKIDIKDCGKVELKENEKQNEVKFGDVFFTVSSETPDEIATASVYLGETTEPLYLNSFCFGFRVNQNIINPFFARYLFRNSIFRRKIMPLAQGSTRFNISKSSFIKLKIKIPNLNEQSKIANCLSAIDQKIDYTQQQLDQTKMFKKGLLQKMFV
ncbi:restriction endonuclease subunit S [Mesohalobacter halotolerans]|uniref:Restriction endonuclease subunit S n=1 Tax=Mesohalobacter halotolerans TaxID=1883405 RepID=A0A4U5TQK4_9FLAO|nr:restriction endonuclease subunit S [Mesohalobacter halotolerans]TKS56490.1 restriction endonuclease subunit S [Mesohalobacter halotolerans]